MSDPTVHAPALMSDIRSAIINKKVNACPMAVRLAWHSAGTFDKSDSSGGSNGAGMRFEPESTDGANAGLGIMRNLLTPVVQANPDISQSDIWVAAGAAAIEMSGGPKCPIAFCRKDAPDNSSCPPNGRLPDAALGAQHLRDVFYRMGFNDQEIVILSGAHTLGSCHLSRSGFDGPWTSQPLVFDNEYFRNLLEKKWVPKKYEGNPMFEDAETGKLGMLPTDIALIEDPDFKKWVEVYAADEARFFKDFSAAFGKLMANGTSCPDPVAAQPKKPEGKDKVSEKFRAMCMHGSEREVRLHAKTADCSQLEINTGRSALHKAAFWGHSHLIDFIAKDCGVGVNVQDFNGDTALHDAAQFGHITVIEKLLAAGADKSVANKEGKLAKDVALAYGWADAAKLV